MTEVEVHIDLEGQVRPLGILYRQVSRRGETVTFEYDATWLKDANRFSIEPALTLTAGTYPPQTGQSIFGSIGDTAPDTWGRRLMQCAERRQAEREGLNCIICLVWQMRLGWVLSGFAGVVRRFFRRLFMRVFPR